jgi:hypothetical protein
MPLVSGAERSVRGSLKATATAMGRAGIAGRLLRLPVWLGTAIVWLPLWLATGIVVVLVGVNALIVAGLIVGLVLRAAS